MITFIIMLFIDFQCFALFYLEYFLGVLQFS